MIYQVSLSLSLSFPLSSPPTPSLSLFLPLTHQLLHLLSPLFMHSQFARYGTTKEQFAKIAVKNHRHSVNNPYAQFQDEYSLEEILNSKEICDPLTVSQHVLMVVHVWCSLAAINTDMNSLHYIRLSPNCHDAYTYIGVGTGEAPGACAPPTSKEGGSAPTARATPIHAVIGLTMRYHIE